ncbi:MULTISPECIES: 16S rRNA (adenine(1518)-N(6)/adenine(1519)-N(6))-dimethyltransferase RsmA [Methanobacterium]|jgi:16S rRNA (adenine1518-N6/adenine1519-N6)-dimethyltransferase|uniref:Probable ribosomal RNA small subunit methyltransferase A n=1 Tax=Methanobacterium subterraneum TaxID=59277 RepID=A0A2H4VRP2_9EURY|nr:MULTISPECIES: 16S rRNA (adenine(1518)-N(6)/adenine(1519)-N(6))-dimethyltransferase RsmA [Methanobacterium]MBW4256207.1 16S ribosomal RNA methyltransferase A [Methanobacterium sp. YSL]PKL71222.1 MAG: 16S rRNA (adenine(1518)-N(6)/adenine(1519)-N(6))-dimethyltransferase [Methanobacteriales archaeon HGW-Methanobacteriales-2]AUB57644.1 16S rRNA (adenine(1518)-N(6)/adenine(1519)-N(6))-dimethyltransferase [Methanobacterium sp. MZ-A1]AUB60774.1 16S rRNA (adenine(1518)-N(6)/adenine(1519)-N(6))-dimeth
MLAQETSQLLKKHQIRLNRRKGQNYLINNHILSRIVENANISDSDVVLEIGAGIGTLTIPLARKAAKVVAFEQDKRIIHLLQERLQELEIYNVEVVEGDATKMEFPYFNKVVSNLPYQISSPITFKLLKYDFDYAILMYQLEFAQRMVAQPGTSNYSRLSVMMHLCTHTELLFKVPPNAFLPPPRISSAVIKLTPRKNPQVEEFFIKTCRALFQHKKKKSGKALLQSFHEISSSNLEKREIRDIISKIDNKLTEKRVFKLEGEEILIISNELKDLMNNPS